MIDKKSLNNIKKELEEFDKTRESVIKQSRDILRSSKKAIFSIHRDDKKNATTLLKEAKKDIDKLKSLANKADLEAIGAFGEALEEYVEAKCFYGYTYTGKIPTNTELKVEGELYLKGISDLTGELGRKAVRLATKGKYEEVNNIKSMMDEIYAFLLELDLRNGSLRKKVDSVKWNLQKVEDIVYDVSIKK